MVQALIAQSDKKGKTPLYFALLFFQADKDVVLAAVAQHGIALKYAAESLRADKDVVFAAMA